ncbi:MAG: hypothetical protein AAGF86_13460 [Pseudomonadota bacterium]
MIRTLLAAALVLNLSMSTAWAGACGAPETWHTLTPEDKASFNGALNLGPKMPTVAAPFDVELKVCSSDTKPLDRLSVDATMPAHKHGMNYQPQLSQTGDGLFKASGFLFHMPGHWKITVSVYSEGAPSHLSMDVNVP